MSTSHDVTPCSEFSALLAPYVDGELGEQEAHGLLEHLDTCDGCTSVVQEQQQVRALIRQLPQPAAPSSLAARVRLALDEVDKEEQRATVQPLIPADTPSWRARWSAMLRGGLVMVPAAAAAALMWVTIRPDPPTAQIPTAAVMSSPRPAAPKDAGPQLAAEPSSVVDLEQVDLDTADRSVGIPPPILGGRRLPQDIEFVSAKPDMVQYRNARRNFQLIDRRQVNPTPPPSSARVVHLHGYTYVLSRDAQGRPSLDFAMGSHAHRLTLVPDRGNPATGTGVGAISAQDPHFAEMLRFARALQRAAAH